MNASRTAAREATVDFRRLPLSKAVRHQLGSIDESRKAHPDQKMALARLLLGLACDQTRGVYIPLASHPYLKAKLTEDFTTVPTQIRADEGTSLCLFGNPLLLPPGIDDAEFDIGSCIKPTLRATNGGFVVATIEYDSETGDQLSELCGCMSPGGKFKEVDAELRKWRDYRGYSVVFSANRSVHFHIVFDTKHLNEAPHQQAFNDRCKAYAEQSAFMANVHQTYWVKVTEVMHRTICPPVAADVSMSVYTQGKRMPWGNRKLEKDSDILGLPKGALVNQLVLGERIIGRAAKGSHEYILSPDFSIPHYLKARLPASNASAKAISAGADMLTELATLCQSTWGSEFPKPSRMTKERGEWTIHFQNHSTDRTPSTIALGEFTTLRVLGQNAPTGPFELPGSLSANELGDHLARRFGLMEVSPSVQPTASAGRPSNFNALREQAGKPFKQTYEESVSRSFPHVSSCSFPELQNIYRQKLWRYLSQAVSFRQDIICTSGEGIGKSWALFDLMQHEALDAAIEHNDGKIRFHVFAFRSRAQAEEKAAEYSNGRRRAIVLKPLWAHYDDACLRVGARPKPKHEFDEATDIVAVLDQIAREQPEVNSELERIHQSLWLAADGTSLFTGTTVIFTTHALAMAWSTTHMTRVWHHPQFRRQDGKHRHEELIGELRFEKVVFDEPEWDEFVYLLSNDLYAHLSVQSRWDWQRLALEGRKEHFKAMKRADSAVATLDFEEYSELRFVDLAAFEQAQVDYFAQPFGRENTRRAIYLGRHGDYFYLGTKRWPFAGSTCWVFLTTERFTTEVISALYESKLGRPLLRLDLDNLPGVYPVDLPVVKSPKARAEKIQELASEILASSDRSVVIANGLGNMKGERAKTFQGMKGYNGWSEKDVFVVLTFLAPEAYAQLNALGQWLNLDDTVAKYYAAQLSQAVGRNTGFRKQSGTKTVVVTTNGLFRMLRSKLALFAPRVRLQLSPDKLW